MKKAGSYHLKTRVCEEGCVYLAKEIHDKTRRPPANAVSMIVAGSSSGGTVFSLSVP